MSRKNSASAPLRPSLFYTPVSIPSPRRPIDVGDRNVFLGSCFAENIGNRFVESGLQAVCNPLGTIYNPGAIALQLGALDAISEMWAEDGEDSENSEDRLKIVVQNPSGQWHTWLTGTSFCRSTPEEAYEVAATAWHQLQDSLLQCDNLFLTFGTSHAYHIKGGWGTDDVVVNCHKHPAKEFRELDWESEDIVETLKIALSRLHKKNPKMQVILTVSPYRYAKYGFHESQLAKARLLLAADELYRSHSGWITYFPAYEIVLDELRDYRFYADDMLHPSPLAVSHIWQRLHDEWFTPACRTYLQQAAPLLRTLQHQPSDPDSPAWLVLKAETEAKLEMLRKFGKSPV